MTGVLIKRGILDAGVGGRWREGTGKDGIYKLTRGAWNRPYPRSPQKEPTLRTAPFSWPPELSDKLLLSKPLGLGYFVMAPSWGQSRDGPHQEQTAFRGTCDASLGWGAGELVGNLNTWSAGRIESEISLIL